MTRVANELANLGIGLTQLEEVDPTTRPPVPQFGDGPWGLRLSLRVMRALRTLHSHHQFDLIEFADWQGIGFRTVQAKRRGLDFSDTDLLVKLHAPSRWERQGNGVFIAAFDDHKLDYCERYAFEHCDTQMSPTRYIARWASDEGWQVRSDLVVSCPYPTADFRLCPSGTISELVFFGRLELRKGLDLFLDVVDGLNNQAPTITFLGRDTQLPSGQLASSMITQRLGPRPHRIESGFDRGEAIEYLTEGGRLAVLPSRSETFGFTVAECIVHMVPFVTCEAGGNCEILGPTGRATCLVPSTAEDLLSGIMRALSSGADADFSLRSQVRDEYDSARSSQSVLSGYGAALERARLRRTTDRVATRQRPTVSLGVTHYNLGPELSQLLPTLMAQTYRSTEVLVIDDGSTDEASLDLFSDLRREYSECRFIEQRNAGPGMARNRLLEECVGELFIPVDADNLALEFMVERYVDSMMMPDRPDVLTCFMLAFSSERDIHTGTFAFQYVPTGGPLIVGCAENVFGDTNAAFRTETLRGSGGFETDISSPWEDWETFVRLVSAGAHLDVVPETLFLYRKRPTGRGEVLGGPGKFLFPFERRLLNHLVDRPCLEAEESRALWETAISYRALERRYLSQSNGNPHRTSGGAVDGYRDTDKPFGYLLADRLDIFARRYPRLKTVVRNLLIEAFSKSIE